MTKYYIYFWFNDDFGGIPIYVGKGSGTRYERTNNRSLSFLSHISKWNCHSEIILDGLDEETACRLEYKMKVEMIKQGYPLLDAETAYRKAITQEVSIARAKERGVVFGRKRKDPPDFQKFLKKQKDGTMTVSDCCEKLGISRATWYNRVAEV